MSKRKSRQFRGSKCLNCETALDISEKYCHQCGQLNSTKKLTIKDFLEEFLSNFYAYDSRLRNSVISIFTKPGVLAKEFNEGKRQKYANPFRLFLSVSIVLFLSFSLTKEKAENNINVADKETVQEIINKNIEKDSLGEISEIGKSKANEVLDKIYPNKIKLSKDSIYTKDFLDKNAKSGFDPISYCISSFRNFNRKYPYKTTSEALHELGYKNEFFYEILYKKAQLFKSNEIKQEIADYFFAKLPFLIFLSLPIITVIFWLVYIRKKLNYTEHLVFSYSFFTFMFICMILFNFIELINSKVSNFVAGITFTIIFPVYFYKSLRNFYQQNRWKTILKFVILNPLFVIFLGISTLIMMFLGIILF